MNFAYWFDDLQWTAKVICCDYVKLISNNLNEPIERIIINKYENCSIPFRRYGTSGLSSGAGSSSGSSDLARSRSSHALKGARDASPLRSATTSTANDDKDGAALSSWARYLKNKYGQVWN